MLKKKDRFGYFKVGILFSLMAIGLCAGILIGTNFQEPIEIQAIEQARYTRQITGDAPLAAHANGFCYLMTYPHQAAPATAYASNLSNASAFEYTEEIDQEMAGETPHSTTFDFVYKIQLNDTVNYNTSGSKYMPSWVYANISVDFDFAADPGWEAMTLVEIHNDSDHVWYNCYLNNGGSGYTITHAETFNLTTNCSAIY